MAVGSGWSNEVHDVAGVRLAAVKSGIRYADRFDLVLVELSEEAKVAGIFTQNAFCAAPVKVAKAHLLSENPKYFLINSGNANAGTGNEGHDDALACCQAVADIGKTSKQCVLPFSTGVIGEKLRVDKIKAAVPKLFDLLRKSNWSDAAIGILTTDTRPKLVSKKVYLDGNWVTITGFAKGSGMIRPDMATMLSYIFTDATMDKTLLNQTLQELANESFNRITVDGDTSTNDASMLAATGASGVNISALNGKDQSEFFENLKFVFQRLAIELIKDAEGATKFITIQVGQGRTQEECLKVAYSVAESPLVKTALFASDPNWGRVLAAIGRAGIKDLDLDEIEINIGDAQIVSNGRVDGAYTETIGKSVMEEEEITISIVLKRGDYKEVVWTSDLSYEYIRINAEYRT
ncbi:bifunctional glutamate N-acetyltransferase/amino-acid acetyltransferase ArgJ [Gammaproteobacteria bacterium]|nr:bifunctional glutamate N-acetyltransferase/amino-acid acetyltransferase ArgJ [Gammaproteobacteria bacterium]